MASENALFPVEESPEFIQESEERDNQYRYTVAWDVEKGDFILDGKNRMETCNGMEGYKVWCCKMALTQRYTVIWKQMLICSIIITAVEFTSGLILNVWLGLGIWDYSNMPFNILGQICLPFTLLWYVLSAPAIILDDYLRYWIFGEEKPHYIWRMQ